MAERIKRKAKVSDTSCRRHDSGMECQTPTSSDAILALGSNVGDKPGNIARAIELLSADGDIRILRRSKNYKTPPWGVTDQDWFVNACVSVATKLDPHQLLQRCQDVENKMGRVRKERWGPRLIDVDILTHRAGAIAEKDLTLPHPRITARAFVLVPLAEIAPELVIAGKTVRAWLAASDATGVEPYKSQSK